MILRSLCPDQLWGPPTTYPMGRGQNVTLSTHHLLPRSRMSRRYISPFPLSSCMACSGTALLLHTWELCETLSAQPVEMSTLPFLHICSLPRSSKAPIGTVTNWKTVQQSVFLEKSVWTFIPSIRVTLVGMVGFRLDRFPSGGISGN
jgi:hypothetical protein